MSSCLLVLVGYKNNMGADDLIENQFLIIFLTISDTN